MDKFSIGLQNELKAIDARPQKLIYFNRNKGRYTIQIVWKNVECILKWNEYDSIEHLNKLKKEILFYEKMLQKNSPYLPKILYIADNYFIQEKLSGDSTRNRIISQKISSDIKIKESLNRIVDAVGWMYSDSDFNICENKNINLDKELKKYVGKMLKSGPMNTKNSYFVDKILDVIYTIIEKEIAKRDNIMLQRGQLIHGDLHLNNLYSTNNNQVYILDWENMCIGSRYFELAYLYAQVNYLLPEEEKVFWKNEMIKKIKFINLSEVIFSYYAELFSAIISCNPRYGYGESWKRIIESQFKLIKIIITGGFRNER